MVMEQKKKTLSLPSPPPKLFPDPVLLKRKTRVLR